MFVIMLFRKLALQSSLQPANKIFNRGLIKISPTFRSLILGCLFFGLSPVLSSACELSFWQFWSQEWIQPSIDKFESDNPGCKIKVERLTWSNGREKLITAMAANSAPDVMEIGSTWAPDFMASGGLLEIGDTKSNNFNLNALDSGTYRGKIYGLPWTIAVTGFYYNKDLLKQAGFSDPPKDWDELILQSEAINNLASDIKGFSIKMGAEVTWQRFLPFVWSNGADMVDQSGNIQVTSINFIEALSFYNRLKKSSFNDTNLATRKLFQQGKLGFIIEDAGQQARFIKNNPDLNFGVTSLPKSPRTGYHKVFSGAQILIISKNTANPILAKKFVNFLVKLENAKLLTDRLTTLFPADKDGINDDFYKQRPELAIFLAELKHARAPLVNPLWPDMQRALVLNVEKVIYGRLTPQQAAIELRSQLLNIME